MARIASILAAEFVIVPIAKRLDLGNVLGYLVAAMTAVGHSPRPPPIAPANFGKAVESLIHKGGLLCLIVQSLCECGRYLTDGLSTI